MRGVSGLTCLLGDVWWFYAGRSSLSLLPASVQLTSASEVQIFYAESTSIPGLRDEQLTQIAAFVLLTCASSHCSSWSQLHGLPQGTSLRQCPFPSRTLGASPALQVEVCSWLLFETGFRNSGHIQQFRVEAISLRAGRVSLCCLDSLHFHLSTYLFAYQGIPDPASCRAGLRRGGSVPEPTSPCTALPQGSRLGDFAQPGKSARLVVPRVADREDVGTSRQRRCPVRVVRTGACSTAKRGVQGLSPIPSLTDVVADPEGRHTSPRTSLTQGLR